MHAGKKVNLKIIKYDGSFFLFCAKPVTILLKKRIQKMGFFFFRRRGLLLFLKVWDGACWICKVKEGVGDELN